MPTRGIRIADTPGTPAHSVTARVAAVLIVAASLAGCVGLASLPVPDTLPQVELTRVPFFPQTDYQCGPAALATVLAYERVPVTADDLVPAVYVEGLRGSLQAELLGATRRHGLVPYTLEPDINALLTEVESGRPVLVLQNLGVASRPRWHYAVVVGFDAERDRVILRSGEQERREERTRWFMRRWALADNWAFVVAHPGRVPASADPRRYVRALADTEALLTPVAALQGYTGALSRWPDEALVAFAAANQQYQHGRLEQAATLYRAAISLQPEHAAARNNLAHVLMAQGCPAAALSEARQALAVAEPGVLQDAIRETLTQLEAAGDGSPSHCR